MSDKVDKNDNDKPPSYEDIQDEFNQNAETEDSSTSTSASEPVLSSSPFPEPHRVEVQSSNPVDKLDTFQPDSEDVFQNPPKFLLYPSNEEQKLDRPTTGSGVESSQNEGSLHKNPSVFTVSADCPEDLPAPSRGRNRRQSLLFDEHMARHSQRILCPYCRVGVFTEIEYVSGTLTHLVALAACWIACLCCVPYCIRELKDVEHYCPECDKILGINKRLDW